jgi:dienelactone hydrolase
MWKTMAAIPVCAALVWAQDWQREVRALRPADASAQASVVLDELEQRARRALEAIPHARTREQADAARAGLRGKLRASLGFERFAWPPDLQPRVVGTLRRPGYRLEKIVYQALPGMPVPAHFYVPDNLAAPAPAVLHYTGHWWEEGMADADIQSFCAGMARLGFVVLVFDTFGQGERGASSRDHRRVEALPVGISQQGFAEYETRCALQYLISRPEVDPQRIGITGASGGGYNTWITSALDGRIACAVPVVGTSEFYEQLHDARPGDFWSHAGEHCHFVPGLLRYANNHELLAMVAPKPLLIVAASKDSSFPLAGNEQIYAYGRELYGSYGAPEKIGFFVDTSSGHGYQQKKREAAYGWFLRWLQHRGDGRPFAEPPIKSMLFDAAELRCFPPGGNLAAGPGMMAAVKRIADAVQPAGEIPRWRVPARQATFSALQRFTVHSEGLDIPGFYVRAASERGVALAVDDSGKEALTVDPVVAHLLSAGWSVCGVDPRGIGELEVMQKGWLGAVSLLLGDDYVGLQARDLARAAALFAGKPVAIYARGPNAALAATYLVPNQERLAWFILRDGFLSLRHLIDRPESMPASFRLRAADRNRTLWFDRELPLPYCPFDALRRFDLPQLLAATAARGIVVNPIDGDWKRMPAAQARQLISARHIVVTEDNPERAIIEALRGAAATTTP